MSPLTSARDMTWKMKDFVCLPVPDQRALNPALKSVSLNQHTRNFEQASKNTSFLLPCGFLGAKLGQLVEQPDLVDLVSTSWV